MKGLSAMADAAWTRNGETCNECGAAVHYVKEAALHFHDEPAPDCSIAKQIREMYDKRGLEVGQS